MFGNDIQAYFDEWLFSAVLFWWNITELSDLNLVCSGFLSTVAWPCLVRTLIGIRICHATFEDFFFQRIKQNLKTPETQFNI